MKRINSIIKMTAIMLAVVFCATSCLKENENNNKTSFMAFFTITGTSPNYVLIDDAGNTFYPTIASVNAITSNKGFADTKRAQLYGNYVETDVTTNADGTRAIKNAELTGGISVVTSNAMTISEAKDANLLNNDSIFDVSQLGRCWIGNGYLTTIYTAQYSAASGKAIVPTANIVVDTDNIKDNEVTFTMLYNRHSSKNVSAAGSTDFVNSVDISKIQIPGKDTVTVIINAQGTDPYKYKVARKYFEIKR